MKKRRGFTLVESVVAMALSLLILSAATSVVITTVNSSRKVNLTQSAIQEVENVLACYQSDIGTSGTNHMLALELLYGDSEIPEITLAAGTKRLTLFFDNENKYIPNSLKAKAAWKIECEDNSDTVSLKATVISNNEVIYEINYTKAS